jgi:hypothetical protein
MLPSARSGRLRGGDAHLSIPDLGRLVRVSDPAPLRSAAGRACPDQQGDPTPSRRRDRRRRHSVATAPRARTARQVSPGDRGPGASERAGGAHRPIVERAASIACWRGEWRESLRFGQGAVGVSPTAAVRASQAAKGRIAAGTGFTISAGVASATWRSPTGTAPRPPAEMPCIPLRRVSRRSPGMNEW